jgi:hypothetical protein
VHALPEEKRVHLLSLLVHSDFADLSTFREQVRFLGDGFRHFIKTFSAIATSPEFFHAKPALSSSR